MASDKKIFIQVNQQIVDDIKKELALQGHHLTGALERSLKENVIDEGGNVIMTASALEYLEKLEKGIPGNQIGIDAKDIEKMANYVKLRMGYTGKYALKVAQLILRKQQKEGNPTKNSYQFSKTGERKFAVEDTFLKNEKIYTERIDTTVIQQLDKQSDSLQSGII